ncbi:MAG: hypothetical protein ACLFWF_12315 [Alphaproteobacteria bacterium]
MLIGAVAAGVAAAGPKQSEATDAGVRSAATATSGDWSLCRGAAAEVEARVSAPEHLLSAVTLTETGRRGPGGKSLQAWPWTINAGGKGYVFTTKNEAVRAVRRLMAQGHRSIDVGCMQVNLKYHPRAFTSLEEAFDPVANLSYGADFLARLKRRHGSWELAVQHYHSYTEEHRQRYAARFRTLWSIERRRMAKAGDEGGHAAARRSRGGSALARLPEIPRTVVRTALPESELSRRLEPVAALMTFGVNVGALGRTAREGNAFLRRLGGRYPAIADTRTKSAALGGPVPVN